RALLPGRSRCGAARAEGSGFMRAETVDSMPRRLVLRRGSGILGIRPSPEHDLIFHGGRTIQDLAFLNVYVAGASAWSASDVANIDRALFAAMSDRNLNNVMMQYFGNRPLSTRFLGSDRRPGAPPAIVSQGDAEALALSLHREGLLGSADLGAMVVNLLLPRGTVLTTDPAPTTSAARREARAIPREIPASSKNGLAGYHGSVHPATSGAGKILYYAIGVYSELAPDG